MPPGWTGKMPNGDTINSSSTFMSIRSFYKNDPDWPKVDAYLKGTGPAPSFNYHRFWAQRGRRRRPRRVRPPLPLTPDRRARPSLGRARARPEPRPEPDLNRGPSPT
ncbi:glycoside hydrolase family 48 protein [Streptosporangium vulgare]|uniref:glycoside hydrolase family 48 protein n=1 Tax=Streptosporangium vulgare TaxID=46190 RepID=UPI0031D0BB80